MRFDNVDSLAYISFFYVDIVGLSNPVLSTNTQTTKINVLNECISQCKTFKSTPKDEMIFSSTGDGMVIGFTRGLEKPIKLALELHERLGDYNKDKVSINKIFTRIGCHSGNVFVVNDVLGNPNCWGPGIILARRIMDLGDENHIFMTSEMADALFQLSDDYKKIIHPLHNYKIKHQQTLLIYSIYGENFGNPKRPVKGLQIEEKMEKLIHGLKNKIAYKNVEFNLFLEDTKTNLLKTKKNYFIENISDEPIFEVVSGIITSVEKTFSELNLKAYDEKDNEISITGINVDTPFRKEFTLKLNSPVMKGEKGKKYSIVYEAEEPKRNYQNLFLNSSENFSLTFNFLFDKKIRPKLFLIDNQKTKKVELEADPHIERGLRTKMRWIKTNGFQENNLIRLEW